MWDDSNRVPKSFLGGFEFAAAESHDPEIGKAGVAVIAGGLRLMAFVGGDSIGRTALRLVESETAAAYVVASFFDSVRSREAGVNPARPPPLSPGTPRARNHWTREIEKVARPGRSPTARDPEARRPAGRNAFLRRG